MSVPFTSLMRRWPILPNNSENGSKLTFVPCFIVNPVAAMLHPNHDRSLIATCRIPRQFKQLARETVPE